MTKEKDLKRGEVIKGIMKEELKEEIGDILSQALYIIPWANFAIYRVDHPRESRRGIRGVGEDLIEAGLVAYSGAATGLAMVGIFKGIEAILK